MHCWDVTIHGNSTKADLPKGCLLRGRSMLLTRQTFLTFQSISKKNFV